MALVFRWLLRIFTGLVVLTTAVCVIAYWFATRSLPDYNASFSLNGVSGPVEIVRSNANVPHIFGETDGDVFFGLGFAHAQDRLWQLMMLRRTAQGRLSELFGPRTVPTDELMRRLDLYNLAVQSVRHQDAKTLVALTAYANGINAWLSEVNKGALGRGAPEFFLFSNQLAPWQPADSIAVMKLIALQQTAHLRREVLRAETSLVLQNERLRDILPEPPGAGIAALPEYADLFPDLPAPSQFASLEQAPYMPVRPLGTEGASNVWAAGASRSASGSTLLANDPHFAFSAPAIWYLARLELDSGGIIGATIPGLPLVLAGRSDGFAWGIAASYLDDLDIYVEEQNPDNPEEVRTPNGFAAMATRASIIQVHDAQPVTLDLRWTQNGPVLPGNLFRLADITPRGHVTSLAWTGLSPSDTTISAWLDIMRARTVSDGLVAGARAIAPSLNLTLADREDIAIKTIGAMPKRDARHQTQGRIPTPGWVAENRWQGRLNYEVNPEFVAPAGGILGNTNNKMVERPFPLHVSHSYGDTQRVQRWRFLMQSREVHTRDSFIEAQLDTVSPAARSLLPLVAQDLWFTGAAAPEGTPERRRQDALALLANWNGEMNEHQPEPLIYAAWMRALQDRLIRDELGPLAPRFSQLEPQFIERVYRDIFGASVWCDVLQSTPKETCTDIARLALDDALVWIEETFGGTLESLHWGDAHIARHDHEILGRIPVLRWLVNIPQSTSGGDNTLNRGLSNGLDDAPFQNVHGAAYRGVYDLADPEASVFILSTGQSGHPLSRHYDDLGVLWRRGEYIPMTLDPALARAATVGITRLFPLE